MSAKSAADALVTFDADLRANVDRLNSRGDYWWVQDGARDEQANVLRECASTWTLSLAAAAGGVSEQQVLIALARRHLHCGTQVCAEGVVSNIYGPAHAQP